MTAGTVQIRVGCRCRPWVAPVQLSRAMLRDLAASGAPPDLVVATTRCRVCKQVVTHRLADFVPWREAA